MPANNDSDNLYAALDLDGEGDIIIDDADIDFSDLEAKYHVAAPSGYPKVVIVDGVPVIDASKEEKLFGVIKKIFKNMGEITENGMWMPKDANGKSKGFLFVEFQDVAGAELAVKTGDNYRMDKAHVLRVCKFDDVETFMTMDEVFSEPIIDPFKQKEHLRSWLSDPQGRDMFSCLVGEEVILAWNNKAEKEEVDHSRKNWTDGLCQWSPLGSYLSTFHKQGIALWGGPSWEKISRFAHPNVRLIDFSPSERYLVTWSQQISRSVDGEYNAIVWDITTGLQLRSFLAEAPNDSGFTATVTSRKPKLVWPLFKWSFDEKYVARVGVNMIQVYETPGMGLLDKKSIKIDGVKDFEWAPDCHLISFWIPEVANSPARVTLMTLPEREIVRTKNLFNVAECKLFWQSAGKYLAVKVDRYTKTKKSNYTNLEIFRLAEKDIPVDIVELNPKEVIQDIVWEPKGDRFAYLATEGTNLWSYFYEVVTAGGAKGGEVKLLNKQEKKGITSIIWSPKGRFCVMGAVQAYEGTLEFWDIEEMQMLGSGEHYLCSNIEFDPTGRFVSSTVSFWNSPTDTGFGLWTFAGQALRKENIPQFKDLKWRPRPPTLLSDADLKRIRKSLKDFTKEFDETDNALANRASRDVIDKRMKLWNDWMALERKWRITFDRNTSERTLLVGAADKKSTTIEDFEEWEEEVIEETEEIVE